MVDSKFVWLIGDQFLYFMVNNDTLFKVTKQTRHLIPNYGERWRYGEAISTGFVESTINEVIAKRMVKKQQMQWTQEGAHYMLQTRTAVLNDDLQKDFKRWYPTFCISHSNKNEVGKMKKRPNFVKSTHNIFMLSTYWYTQ